jgi:hypothetical protein
LHGVEDGDGIGDIRVDVDRDLEGTEGYWRTGDGDRCGQMRGSAATD